MTPRIRIVCGDCGSDDVRRDAFAEWDEDTQAWVLGQVFDEGFCARCDEARSLDEVEIGTARPAFEAILSSKRWTVRMPWMALPDAVAVYQGGAEADEHEWFSLDWFDESGQWPLAHVWR